MLNSLWVLWHDSKMQLYSKQFRSKVPHSKKIPSGTSMLAFPIRLKEKIQQQSSKKTKINDKWTSFYAIPFTYVYNALYPKHEYQCKYHCERIKTMLMLIWNCVRQMNFTTFFYGFASYTYQIYQQAVVDWILSLE